MDPRIQKEQFQIAYVYALAAHAGLNPGHFDVDDDSVDIVFKGKGYAALVRNPQIHIQLKCTSQDIISGDVLKFQLSRKNYDDLRGDNVIAPQYLAVLLVPESPDDWLQHHDNHIALHKSCFWLSLRDAPTTANATSVTVDVPLAQRLTSTALLDMMAAASQGGAL